MLKYRDLTEEQKKFVCNGCGGKSGWINPPEFLFNASCNHHDFLYWRGCTEADVLKAIAKGTEYWVKHRKNTELDTLVVTTSTVPFDADNASINYMSAVLTIANLKMIQALAAGVNAVDAYASIYNTSISWKNANNTISNVQLETVGEVLEQCMAEIGNIKTGVKYNG